jgi:hypothetical protein
MDHTRHHDTWATAPQHTPTTGPDPLARTERHLRLIGHTGGHAALERWRTGSPELTAAPITAAAELPGWLHTQPTTTANRILGHLVTRSQHDDQLALVAVLACLAPGIRSLAAKARVRVDEALSEVTIGILGFPVHRRTSIAGGLLLDARNRLWRTNQKHHNTEPLDPTDDTTHPTAPGDLGNPIPAAQHLIQIVCQAHRQGLVDHTEARLILDTRLGGHHIRPLAQHLGLTTSAAYQRRNRAETRLTHAT